MTRSIVAFSLLGDQGIFDLSKERHGTTLVMTDIGVEIHVPQYNGFEGNSLRIVTLYPWHTIRQVIYKDIHE